MPEKNARLDLCAIAHQAMLDRGLEPDLPLAAIQQLQGIEGPARDTQQSIRDLRQLPWCSIDNDHSMDLDQLTVAEKLPGDTVKVLVAIADVDAIVKAAIDSCVEKKENIATRKARQNANQAFAPSLPEFTGGSVDLTGSNLTNWRDCGAVRAHEAGNHTTSGVRKFDRI